GRVEHTLRLRPDGGHDLGMVGAHVEGADAAREIDVAVAVDVHEGGAPGRGDEDGVLLVDAAGNVLLAEPCELSRPGAWHWEHGGDRPIPSVRPAGAKSGLPRWARERRISPTGPWPRPASERPPAPQPRCRPGSMPRSKSRTSLRRGTRTPARSARCTRSANTSSTSSARPARRSWVMDGRWAPVAAGSEPGAGAERAA